MKQVLFLYNPQSGKGKIEKDSQAIGEMFRQAGYSIVDGPIDFSRNPFNGHETVDLVVVAGGDGTVNYVVNRMKEKHLDLLLGIIPAGTANDFAGALGMEKNPVKAAAQLLGGTEERVDCGRVNDHYFVNIFSFGIFTTTSQRTPDKRKHQIGKPGLPDRGREGVPLGTRHSAANSRRRQSLRPRIAHGLDIQRRNGRRIHLAPARALRTVCSTVCCCKGATCSSRSYRCSVTCWAVGPRR